VRTWRRSAKIIASEAQRACISHEPSIRPLIGDPFDSNLEIRYEALVYLASHTARLRKGKAFELLSGDPSAEAKIHELVECARSHARRLQTPARWTLAFCDRER
jgi:hypothetical protein